MSIPLLELHPGDEFIELYKVLKIQGWVGGGGEAKLLIADGYVVVNDEVETRKRRKLVAGDVIQFADETLQIAASTRPACEKPKPVKTKPIKSAKVDKPKGRPSIKFN